MSSSYRYWTPALHEIVAGDTPVIDSLTPDRGRVGTLVTIAGSNFEAVQGTGTVTFNGVEASVTSWSDTEIVCTVPVGAATGNVVVTNDSGNSSAGKVFTVAFVGAFAVIVG